MVLIVQIVFAESCRNYLPESEIVGGRAGDGLGETHKTSRDRERERGREKERAESGERKGGSDAHPCCVFFCTQVRVCLI